MCTALTLKTKDHYFGRTLDLNRSYGEEICVLPRRSPLSFRRTGESNNHYAMIGMATVADGIPLYYDGVNEHGLAMAGLNFPGNACYLPESPEADNVAPFEFIPWILSQCRTVSDARKRLERVRLANLAFNDTIPPSPLHWIIADRDESVVVEPMEDGLHLYDNPAGVMTNNPPFPYQLFYLNNFRHLRTDNGENHFSQDLPLDSYCQGLGGLGLPGDVSSMSRFVRIAFGRAHSLCEPDELSSVSQFFHLLGSVEMPRGVCLTPAGDYDITVYTACMNTDRGLYYYSTYDNCQISCVDLHREDLNGSTVSRFPLIRQQQIRYMNL